MFSPVFNWQDKNIMGIFFTFWTWRYAKTESNLALLLHTRTTKIFDLA